MTDLEMIKLCAEAMGKSVVKMNYYGGQPACVVETDHFGHDIVWWPEDHLQEMIERYGLEIHPPVGLTKFWYVASSDGFAEAQAPKLIAAVVECVAKMWKRP